jgi:hemoglobin-like flavoprotein
MTPKQRMLLQLSFTQLSGAADEVADRFHQRLLGLDSEMPRTDLKTEGRKLLQLIGLAVRNLDDPDQVSGAARDLGREYASLGLTDEHFDTMGEALLWTLEQFLGEGEPGKEERAAWILTYQTLTGWMKEGAQGVASSQGPAAVAS